MIEALKLDEFDTWLLIFVFAIGTPTILYLERDRRRAKRRRQAADELAYQRSVAREHALRLSVGDPGRGPLRMIVRLEDDHDWTEFDVDAAAHRYHYDVTCSEHPEQNTTASSIDWLRNYGIKHWESHGEVRVHDVSGGGDD